MVVLGIDVGKHHLDCADYGGKPYRYANTPEGIAALLAHLSPIPPSLVVLEPTGGYERPAFLALSGAGYAVALVNPRQVRQFARSVGLNAKTDRLDALLLARFGHTLQPTPRPPVSPESLALVALVARRRQLLAIEIAERNRLTLADAETVDSLRRHLAYLAPELLALSREIALAVASSPLWAARASLLQTVPGVGPLLAAILLVELPELGSTTGKRLTGLVGLAPYAGDSGTKRGHRSIYGGRAHVRAALYMPALTSLQHNPVLKAHYYQLRARGKPHKVAIVACMRRLLVILNAIAASGTPWIGPKVPIGDESPVKA